MSVLRRVTGLGTAGCLALALLAGGCVLAATAGPRQAQATGTRALAQTMGRLPPVDKDIVVSSSWAVFNSTVDAGTGIPVNQNLAQPDIGNVTVQLRRDFGRGPLRLAPQPTDWFGMNPGLYDVLTSPPGLKSIPGKLEVTYRYPLAGNLRLVSGRMPDTAPEPTSNSTEEIYHLQVVVTPQTARRFGLRPGSQLPVSGPADVNLPGKLVVALLDVTGIVEPGDPGSSFWDADPLLPAPALDRVGASASWDGAVIADPGELGTVQRIFGQGGLLFQWQLPTDPTGLHGQAQAQALYKEASQIANQVPRLTGTLASKTNALSVSFGLVQPLAAFILASNDVDALLALVYVGLAVAAIVTLLLAALMIAARRSAELTVLRARGASLWQLFSLGTRGAAVACVPAAALAWAIAAVLVPGAAPSGPAAWWPGIATLAFATASPGAAAAWQHRLPRRDGWRRWRWLPRVVVEVTACAAAIGGITVFRAQTGATDLYTSAAPVLVAVPVVIVILRVYQLLLRGLARASARQRGVIGFLGLTRAAQAPLTLALPALTLVLALTVAAFTGMVKDAVVSGETAVSWQTTGADVVVAAPSQLAISPAAVRAIAAVPGVKQAASVLAVPVTIAGGTQVVTAIVVDPVGYAALAASAEGFSPVRPALLSQPRGQGAIPVLASPQAAAYLDGPGGTAITAQEGLPALRVRVAGELQSTPALPGGGAFMVLPRSAISGVGGPLPVNLMLLTGASIDVTRLNSAVQATMPGVDSPTVTTRSRALQELTGSPLQQGTFLLFTLAIGYAAALALAVMLLELALGAADRAVTASRLATMGLTEGQRVRLVALEVLPSIAAAAAAAVACAIELPGLVAPAIDLSVFTDAQAPVPLRPDFAALLLPLAALLAITIIALGYEIRSGRKRGVASTMRA
jgi:putative ABC transport system permease protein